MPLTRCLRFTPGRYFAALITFFAACFAAFAFFRERRLPPRSYAPMPCCQHGNGRHVCHADDAAADYSAITRRHTPLYAFSPLTLPLITADSHFRAVDAALRLMVGCRRAGDADTPLMLYAIN